VISNYINPWIVDIGASLISMGCLILFLKVLATQGTLAVAGVAWQGRIGRTMARQKPMDKTPLTQTQLWSALLPWDHRLRRDADLGHRAFKTWAKLDLYLETTRSRVAQ